MKATRKLIPALAMLLVSAVMMSTASFAWFSMNKDVDVTGMNIVAKSDNAFLVISTGSVSGEDMLKVNAISANTSTTDVELFPVMAATTLTSAIVATPNSWQYAVAATRDASAKNAETYKACTDLTDYVASETFTVGLNKASKDEVTGLKVKAVSLPADTGICVVIVCGTTIYHYKANVTSGTDVIAATVSKTTPAVITVYYYIDGENTNVYSDNISALHGSVNLTFGID